ncbi:MAG: histidine kinase N-terminal 7TM domain-containing protein [Phototrophicaceae bacterium]
MHFQFPPIIILYTIAAVVASVVCFRAWALRPARGTNLLVLTMIASVIWSLGEALTLISGNLTWILAVTRLQYVGIVGIPVLWVLFALSYSNYLPTLNRWVIGGVALPGVTMLLVVWTLHWHNWLYTYTGVISDGRYLVFDREYGFFFWIWVAYSYGAILIGSIFLVQSVLRFPNLFKGQSALLIAAATIPLFFSVMYLFVWNPIEPYDPSSLGFVLSGLFMLLAISGFRLFEVVPIAYDLVFNTVQAGVIITNLEDVVVNINPTGERVVQQNRNLAIGKPATAIIPSYATLLEKHAQDPNAKLEVTTPDKQLIYEAQVMPLMDRRGNPNGRLLLFYDVTEQKLLVQELDAYARSVAHDLKSPLNSIVGYLSLIQVSATLDEETNEYLQHAINNSDNMVEIIESLLLLSNIRAHANIQLTTISIERLTQDVLEAIHYKLVEANAVVEKPAPLLDAHAYAPWVRIMLMNYITNALKYGGTPPTIRIWSEAIGERVRYCIGDNGAGLTPDEQARLFHDFTRLDRHRAIVGHGLGLSIVRRIIPHLQGQVGITSELGKGSVFYFELLRPRSTGA